MQKQNFQRNSETIPYSIILCNVYGHQGQMELGV